MIRCSSIPRLLACPSSHADGWRLDEPSEPGQAGSAVHLALADLVAGREPDLAACAARYGADPAEVERLHTYGRRAWAQLAPQLPTGAALRSEVALAHPLWRGTADIAAHDGERALILDWKTGRVRRDHSAQVAAYAGALAHEYGWPTSGHITVALVWLQAGDLEVVEVRPADVAALEARVKDALTRCGKDYAPGEACAYCPRVGDCQPRAAWLRTSALALADAQAGELTPALLGRLHPQAKALRKALDAYDAALRSALQAGGPIALADGGELALVERQIERLRPREAWPLLEDAIGLDALAEVVTISKTAALDAVGKAAGKGLGSRAKGAMIEKLRAAGALATETQIRVELTRKGASDE